MSGLPKSWDVTRLSEIAVVEMGQSPPSSSYNYVGEGLPFFQGKAEFGKTYPSVQKWTSNPLKIAEADDILLSVRAPVGPTNLATEKCSFGRGLASIRADKPFNQKYLFYLFRNIEPWLSQQGTGSTFAGINSHIIRSIDIQVAPLKEQAKIVDKLDKLLAKIDTCQERLDRVRFILERFRRSVLAEATSGTLTQDWREEENNENDFGLNSFDFEDATCFGNYTFPSSWRVCRLEDIAEITSGITKSSKLQDPSFEEIPYLRVANVQRGYFDLTDVKTIRAPQQQIEDRLLESGDILFNEGGDIDKLGRGWVWSGEIERCIFQNHVFRARLNEANFNPKFFSHYSNSRGADYFLAFGKQTTNLASINKTILSALPVVVPPAEEQHEIVRRIEMLFAFADRIETRYQKAQTHIAHMIPTLLDKAFRGELVPQDPNDEPASVLLERIQEARVNASVQQKKPRRRSEMADKKTNRRKKGEPISIVQALSDAGQELSANDLFIEAGYPSDADSEQIEAFFVAVRDALLNKEISKTRRHDIDWFTLESEITTNED